MNQAYQYCVYIKFQFVCLLIRCVLQHEQRTSNVLLQIETHGRMSESVGCMRVHVEGNTDFLQFYDSGNCFAGAM